MDKLTRDSLISGLQYNDSWRAICEWIKEEEASTFESLLHGVSKEEVVAKITVLRKLKRLPELAASTAKG